MFFARRARADPSSWEGIVTSRSRGVFDGSNMYHRITVRLADGTSHDVRVSRKVWRSLHDGDRVVKKSGRLPEPADQ
ncbi:DUF7489 domain-containing protein [Nocardia sp. CA-135398]|uniref:DUF7489 domain-containing protein n=1 Tax=Nocardia sp. CA-135398 TaxID=3239977 RepID=UPI003D95ED6B